MMPGNKWPIVVTSREELARLVDAAIYHEGPFCDLNHLNISAVTDLSKLFQNNGFEGDISKWDVSNVQDMSYMFMSSNFNKDISG